MSMATRDSPLVRGDGPADGHPHRPARRRPSRGGRTGLWFVTPFIAILTLFMLVPIGYAIDSSLYTTKLIGGTSYSGLANYRTVLSAGEFWSGVERVLLFAVVQVPLTLGLALFFAVVFDAGIARFGRAFRVVYFMPFAVPAVVASVMWSFLLLPTLGPYTRLLRDVGLGNVNFFSSTMIVPTIVLIVVWEWTGYTMTILYTALRAIPNSLTEAAILDGASFVTIVRRIKIPMIKPALIMLAFINTVGALQLFTEPSILSAFQPQAVSFGFTPSLYVYNTAIGSAEYNLGAAAAVILGLIIGAISIASVSLRRRSGELS